MVTVMEQRFSAPDRGFGSARAERGHGQPLLIRAATVPVSALTPLAATSGVMSSVTPSESAYATVDITITNGRITDVAPSASTAVETSQSDQFFDATGYTVLPGFIDVHVHGGAGYDTMDATAAALAGMARFFAKHGVTAFLPTTITAPHAEIMRAVAAVNRWGDEPTGGARILGVHVEGPYLSPHYPGAQPVGFIRQPNCAEFLELVAAGPVRMMTFAPEEDVEQALLATVLEQKVIAVWGHTDATYDQCVAAASAGFTQATHTYNAMSGLHHRKPGVLGATLTIDSIYAQLIADTIHVHPAAMQVLARCKGLDRTILITDAMRAAGLADGKYDLGGQQVTVADGACRLADGTLAGSILTMDQALRNFLTATGLPLAEAWPVTSRTPAQSLGLADQFGTIAAGYWGDLVVLDTELSVVATIVGGRVVN